ncbi:hypothetical protein TeGR_g1238 [Tetraparma gracilis]|jgi:hypothetical protein|uniref:Uncharacterized protein n=1 Tax=Tetraparma gracilis TaxID=2962635 RepID=A0ABQ6M507_9STRA|nr:hypothetical protein TeGR_g1238 [Tetraparma gracilis]
MLASHSRLPLLLLLLLPFLVCLLLPSAVLSDDSAPPFENFITVYDENNPSRPFSLSDTSFMSLMVSRLSRFKGTDAEMQLINNFARDWGGLDSMRAVHSAEELAWIATAGERVGSNLASVAAETGEEVQDLGEKVLLVSSQLNVLKERRSAGPPAKSGKTGGKKKRKKKKKKAQKSEL